MDQTTDLDARLQRVVMPDGAGEPVPEFSWDTVRLRAASLRPVRHRPSWRWWLALGVVGTCMSGTAAAMASPQASVTMQQVLAKVHLVPPREVSFAQAQADAGYPLIHPAGLPAGTKLEGITELPAVGAAPTLFTFRYRTAAGDFQIGESPAGGPAAGAAFVARTAPDGHRVVFGFVKVAPGGTGAGSAGHGGAAAAVVNDAGSAPQTKTVSCPPATPCRVGVHNGHVTVHVGPQAPLPPPSGAVGAEVRSSGNGTFVGSISNGRGKTVHFSAVSWTVGGTELTLVNSGALSPAQIEAIRAATK